jgi:hypothetical protein
MYLIQNENYVNKIISNDRVFSLRLTLGSSTVLTGTTIQDIALDEITNSTDTLTMGCACSHKITINLINPPTNIDYDGIDFTAEVGLLINDRPITYEWIPLGKFYGAEAETSNDFKNLKLVAYDGFYKMTDKYIPRISGTVSLQAVYDDLKTQLYENCGIVLKARTLPEYTIENFPNLDITYTQAVGYVAGCLGEFARFDRNGELEFAWYTDTEQVIERSQQYMGGFKRTTDKSLTITSISTGTQETPIVRGSGANGININFENPYITGTMADDIYNKINGFTYTPCQIKWRGNPAIQAGDMVKVVDKDSNLHNVLIMSQSIKVGGGCNSSAECKGKNENTSNFSNNFESASKKIDRIYKGLEQAILDATNKITGNTGGFVEILDTNNDGKPDEIVIMDSENRTVATKVWRWNKEGLGYSHNPAGNAYLGPYKTAITADGQINADFIATGTLKLGGYNNASGKFELYGNANDLICSMDNEGLTIFAPGKGYVTLNAVDGLVGYDTNHNKIYWVDDGVFHMENAEVENEIKIAGKIKIVPVDTGSSVGIGFVALV